MSLRNQNVFKTLPDKSLFPAIQEGSYGTHPICYLGKEFLTGFFFNWLVQHDINIANQLSLTCKGFHFIFQYLDEEYIDKLTANYLLRALINASYFSRELLKHITIVKTIQDIRPEAIFTQATAKGPDGKIIQCSPLAYVFKNQDVAFQGLFYNSARRMSKLELFVEIAEMTPSDVNVDFIVEAYFSFLEAANKPESEAYTDDEINKLNALFCKLIVFAQAKLPRWIIDRFIDPDQIWNENHEPGEYHIPSYDVNDFYKVRENMSLEFNLLDENETKLFGRDYGLTRLEMGEGHSESCITNKFEGYDVVRKDYLMIASFFNNRPNVQRALLARVKQEVEEEKAASMAL